MLKILNFISNNSILSISLECTTTLPILNLHFDIRDSNYFLKDVMPFNLEDRS